MKKNLLTKSFLPHQKPVAQSNLFVKAAVPEIVLNVPEVIHKPIVKPLPQSEEILNKPIAPSEKKMSVTPKIPETKEELTIIEEPYIPGSIVDVSDTETIIGNTIID